MKDGVITVVLVDDHAVVRAGLKAVLGTAKDIDVIGEGSTGKDAISLAERLDPDVIVMDLSMGEMDGAEATKELVGKKTRQIIWSQLQRSTLAASSRSRGIVRK